MCRRSRESVPEVRADSADMHCTDNPSETAKILIPQLPLHHVELQTATTNQLALILPNIILRPSLPSKEQHSQQSTQDITHTISNGRLEGSGEIYTC